MKHSYKIDQKEFGEYQTKLKEYLKHEEVSKKEERESSLKKYLELIKRS